MNAISEVFAYLAGVPAVVGLTLAALTIFLTSDWRLSLTALLVQYILIGTALTRFIRVEVAIVKILVGVLAVAILYLTARRIQEQKEPVLPGQGGRRFLGMNVGWGAGPLGLPLRLMAVFLAILAVIRAFENYDLPWIPAEIAFAALWMGAIGVFGLILSGDSLRVAAALLTILGGFDLVYAGLETSLAVAGLWGMLVLMASLAFAYLATAQGLGMQEMPAPSLQTPVRDSTFSTTLPAQAADAAAADGLEVDS